MVFHQALLQDSSVWKGCSKETAIIIALEPGQEMGDVLFGQRKGGKSSLCNMGTVYGLEAQKIAIETHSRINVVMMGAVLKVMGLDSLTAGEQIMEDTLGKKYPDALNANLEGMRRGYDELRILDVSMGEEIATEQQGQEEKNNATDCVNKNTSDQHEWGYDNAPIGGINPRFGNSVISDLSPSRQGYIPLFIKERCINCGLVFRLVRIWYFSLPKVNIKAEK